MTAMEARRIVHEEFVSRGIAYSSIKAKTVSFADLARASAVFVTVVASKTTAPLMALDLIRQALRPKGVVVNFNFE